MLWILFGNLAYLYIVWKLTLYQLPAIWVIFWGRSYGGQCVRVRPYPHMVRCLFPIPYCLPCPTLPRHSCHALPCMSRYHVLAMPCSVHMYRRPCLLDRGLPKINFIIINKVLASFEMVCYLCNHKRESTNPKENEQ